MTSKQLFVFGLGYSARAIANSLAPWFDCIIGTSRSPEKLPNGPWQAIAFDGLSASQILLRELQSSTHLIVSIAPGEGDPVLAAIPELLSGMPHLQWIGYLSTVGVYGNHDGAWVDEDSEPQPVSARSIARLQAENAWQSEAEKAAVPLAVFRLSGIYGPGRNAFVTIEKGWSRRLIKPGQVFNRIHRDDIAKAVASAVAIKASGTFNITDDRPAPPQDVVEFAHQLMDRTPPPAIDFETADLTPMARSFYGENKRVSNAKSKTELKMQYDWPDYEIALQRMWQEKSWQADAIT